MVLSKNDKVFVIANTLFFIRDTFYNIVFKDRNKFLMFFNDQLVYCFLIGENDS